MIKQSIATVSVLACIWLLSALELGLVGDWAVFFIFGVSFVLVAMMAFSKWKQKDNERIRERNARRAKRKMAEQKDKELYLRNIA